MVFDRSLQRSPANRGLVFRTGRLVFELDVPDEACECCGHWQPSPWRLLWKPESRLPEMLRQQPVSDSESELTSSNAGRRMRESSEQRADASAGKRTFPGLERSVYSLRSADPIGKL